MDVDLFGNEIKKDLLLRDKFIEPPFSILDTKTPSWIKRKKLWKSKGIKSELGRDVTIVHSTFTEKYGRKSLPTESIFDPALTELMYKWFCPDGGLILDPFAGGSVRGIVANYLGYKYTGIELRKEQVENNILQGKDILLEDNQPNWITGDSDTILENEKETYDMIFSCPPYFNLECYSELKEDLSTMNDNDFEFKYQSIIKKLFPLLKNNSYAVFITGDVRSKDGYYRLFTEMTIRCFINAGFKLYNKAILLHPIGTAAFRADRFFRKNRKLVKVHEDILIFKKPL